MTNLPNNVLKLSGAQPGPTIAIFGGVHGNERAGLLTLDYLSENLTVARGTVYLVRANPEAIAQDKRLINKNLNRLFLRSTSSANAATTYEDKRANELMNLLDTCDALLDLHSYNDPEPNHTPFAICEDNCDDIARTLDVPFRIGGFTATEPGGSDGYMYIDKKVGICVELGSVGLSEEMAKVGVKIAMQFLQYFNCIDGTQAPRNTQQTVLTAHMMYKKNTDDFQFTQSFKTLDFVAKGTVIAIDGGTEIIAQQDVYILFPRAEYAIGIEAFILVNAVDSHHTHLHG